MFCCCFQQLEGLVASKFKDMTVTETRKLNTDIDRVEGSLQQMQDELQRLDGSVRTFTRIQERRERSAAKPDPKPATVS